MSVEIIASSDFEQVVLKSEVPVLVDFYADWCGPCKMMSPILDQIAAELQGQVKIVKVNVDQSPDLSQQFGVMSIPTMIVFKNGELVDKVIGARPKAELVQLLTA